MKKVFAKIDNDGVFDLFGHGRILLPARTPIELDERVITALRDMSPEPFLLDYEEGMEQPELAPEDEVLLEDMTNKALTEMLVNMGVDVPAKATKAELIALVEGHTVAEE